MKGGLGKLSPDQVAKITIAYEPVWAIGTGKTATPQMAQEVHRYIRSMIARQYGFAPANQVRVLYGGSVKPDNVKGLDGTVRHRRRAGRRRQPGPQLLRQPRQLLKHETAWANPQAVSSSYSQVR